MKTKIELKPVKKNSATDRRKAVQFVNQYYKSPFPLEEASLKDGKIVLFWAYEKKTDKLIGTTGYMPKTPYLVETAKTVIHPDFRGQGLGEALSQAIEDEVKSRGFKKIMATIYVTNLPMIFIKLKQGYLFEGFHPDHEKPGLHEYSLGKVLK
jgi:GNAT superfamily N-acetyltransferase